MMAINSIGTAELKLSSGSVSTKSTTGVLLTLPGGSYGHWPQISGQYNTTAYVGWNKASGIAISSMEISSSTPTAVIRLTSFSSSYYTYASQNYHASSGEVFWIFALRDKATKDIICMYQSPDHPAYGNGGDPNIVQHPFPGFNPDTEEIVVINPAKEDVDLVMKGCLDADGLEVHDPLEIILRDYEIDESTSPEWPSVPVTVGVVSNIHHEIARRSRPIKKVATRPKGAITARLRRKQSL